MMRGEGVICVSFREDQFRIRFWEPFRLVLLSVLFLGESYFLVMGDRPAWSTMLVTWLAAAAFCAAAILLMVWKFPFQIGPEGIQCYDFWSRPVQLRWDEISGHRLVYFGGVNYLLLKNDAHPTVWLPLFVDREEVLFQLLDVHAPRLVTQLNLAE